MGHDTYIVKEGFPFIGIAFFLTAISIYFGYFWPTLFLLALTVFIICFFRNPERKIPADETAIVSPADGKVIKIEEVVTKRGPFKLVCIFMNVFNVHVNRIPYGGTITAINYYPGKFIRADLDKASVLNERNQVVLETPRGEIIFVQIAGLIARRIVSWINVGLKVEKGARFGLIRFGSRVDVYLPRDVEIRVQTGQKVKAGETVIGGFR